MSWTNLNYEFNVNVHYIVDNSHRVFAHARRLLVHTTYAHVKCVDDRLRSPFTYFLSTIATLRSIIILCQRTTHTRSTTEHQNIEQTYSKTHTILGVGENPTAIQPAVLPSNTNSTKLPSLSSCFIPANKRHSCRVQPSGTRNTVVNVSFDCSCS